MKPWAESRAVDIFQGDMNLFGFDHLFGSIGGGYILSDANIDFYDSQTLIGIALLGWNFP